MYGNGFVILQGYYRNSGESRGKNMDNDMETGVDIRNSRPAVSFIPENIRSHGSYSLNS